MTAAAEGRANLARHRRFLLAMCVIVITYYGLRARFLGDVSYSGFGFHIERPDLVPLGLWLVWGWALLVYWQRFNKLFDPVWKSITRDVDVEDLRLALRAARREAVRKQKAGEIETSHTQLKVDPRTIDFGEELGEIFRRGKRRDELVRKKVSYHWSQDGGRIYPRVEGVYSAINSTGGQSASSFQFEMKWAAARARRHRIRSWLSALWRLPGLTEHLVPFLVAAVALGSPWIFPQPLAEPISACGCGRSSVERAVDGLQ